MCRLAFAEGTHTIVACAEWHAGRSAPPDGFDEYESRLERLSVASGVALRLVPGFALAFGAALPALAARYETRITLGGGRQLLVTLPALDTPPEAEAVWAQLAELGFGVVVARPECSPALRSDAARLDAWVAGGVTLQLDAASVCGAHGREAQRFALRCVRRYASSGGVLLASNARDAGPRRPSLSEASAAVAKKFGAGRARALVEETPARILGEDASATPRNFAGGISGRLRWPLRRAPWTKPVPEES